MNEYRPAESIRLYDIGVTLPDTDAPNSLGPQWHNGGYSLHGPTIKELAQFFGKEPRTIRVEMTRDGKLESNFDMDIDGVELSATRGIWMGPAGHSLEARIVGPHLLDIRMMVYDHDANSHVQREYTYCGTFGVEWLTV